MSVNSTEAPSTGPGQRQPAAVRVTVNRQPVDLPDRELTGLQIKQAAIAQHVEIQLDFPLSVKHGGRFEPVGDNQPIRVHEHEEFLAVPPDDNS
jgi:hypothetical protein